MYQLGCVVPLLHGPEHMLLLHVTLGGYVTIYVTFIHMVKCFIVTVIVIIVGSCDVIL